MKKLLIVILMMNIMSCQDGLEKRMEKLNMEWKGKEIVFPMEMLCIAGNDTVEFVVPNKDFTIVTYINDRGDNLKNATLLRKWKEIIQEIDTLSSYEVAFHFIVHSSDVKLLQVLTNYADFPYTICMDKDDRTNTLNRFPEEKEYRTFLLDNQRKVILMGNPFASKKTEDKYKQIMISGNDKDTEKELLTDIDLKNLTINLGEFDCNTSRKITFSLKNVGKNPLVIRDVITTSLSFAVDYSKSRVYTDKTWKLDLEYTAEFPHTIDREVLVYCNLENSPLRLTVKGHAK